MKPKVITGNIFKDSRGIIRHTNDFKLLDACRFYTIQHHDTQTIRAWQGHQIETKYFIPIKGSFVVAWVEVDDFQNPSKNLKAEFELLSDGKPIVLHIPPGHANGLRALEPNSIIGVFSDMENEESVKEKIRFPSEWWFDWFQNFNKTNNQ
jgi:dTDP-4-dehydrorhamnose 3,5-epimerase